MEGEKMLLTDALKNANYNFEDSYSGSVYVKLPISEELVEKLDSIWNVYSNIKISMDLEQMLDDGEEFITVRISNHKRPSVQTGPFSFTDHSYDVECIIKKGYIKKTTLSLIGINLPENYYELE